MKAPKAFVNTNSSRHSFMLAKDTDDWRPYLDDTRWTFEQKWDGTRCLVVVRGGNTARILGRGILKDGTQRDYTVMFPEILTMRWPAHLNADIDGEIVCLDESGRNDFNRVQHRITRKEGIMEAAREYPATFLPFDIVLPGLALRERRELAEKLGINLTPWAESSDDKKLMLKRILSDSKAEGIIIKDTTSHYIGARSPAWLKWKKTVTTDVFCEGEVKPGTGKIARLGTFGHLVCYAYKDGIKTEVGHVGGGFTDADRLHIQHEILDKGKVPFVIEIFYYGWASPITEGGKMRMPQFLRLRHDKEPKDCVI